MRNLPSPSGATVWVETVDAHGLRADDGRSWNIGTSWNLGGSGREANDAQYCHDPTYEHVCFLVVWCKSRCRSLEL